MYEISAGIIVFAGENVLIIRNRFNEWVLPKGKINPGETPYEAALREVLEETSVRAKILCFLGETNYTYTSDITGKLVDKTVHWYAGVPVEGYDNPSLNTKYQKEEGITSVRFVSWQSAMSVLTYEDSSTLVKLARKRILNLDNTQRGTHGISN
ncbi:MAG: NUDIX hydrolase [Firmicutes bacterium]|nr:NUDIX hydrolase [Bacillota bacterium]